MSFPTTQTTTTDLAAAFREIAPKAETNTAGRAFLKFDFRTGTYTVGREQDDCTGDEVAVNTFTLSHGWVLWTNGKATKTMAPVTQALPEAPAPVGEDTPTEARGLECRFTDGDDTQIVFETNSFGGRSAVDALVNEVRQRSMAGEQTYLFPLCKLTSESYVHKKHNSKIFNPKLEVVAWLDMEGNREGDKPQQLEADLPEPQAEAEEAPKPTRRRRRQS